MENLNTQPFKVAPNSAPSPPAEKLQVPLPQQDTFFIGLSGELMCVYTAGDTKPPN